MLSVFSKWKPLTTSIIKVMDAVNRESLGYAALRLNNKMSKNRTYSDAFLRYGFVNLPSGGEDRPQCVVCHKVLTNESLKPSKLSAHLQKCHQNLQNEDQAHFQRRAVALKNIQFGSSGIQARKLQAAVEASYFVAYKVAEQQK
ncbi:protein FAM200B-like isoform X1 [Tachypleus tridentatus]|uniref:protein FAM200B-like isoform X1 n=1 Tax=Tachypleus tridentatus TaxID=6853 RepID=UPI003FD3CF5E